jgi:branched-chain amino acid transport system ATP-binding protein
MAFIRWIREEFHLAVLLIEHQMRLVMNLCQRLLVLDFGVTIAQGAPDEIRQNPLVLKAYLGETKTL